MKQPNILIFNPDEWRGDAMGHLGDPAALTLNLDALVSKYAVSFRNAFCQNPICTPSRCSFMTGRYPHVRGHRTMRHMLRDDESNLLQVLKDNDYFIWWGGKNDLFPGQHGFDEVCDVRFKATQEDHARWGLRVPDYDKNGQGAPDALKNNPYSFYNGRLEKGESSYYLDPDASCVLGAVDFLDEYDGERPFCLFLSLNNPHPNYGVEEPFYSAIDRGLVPPPIPAPEDWSGKSAILKGVWERQNNQALTPSEWTELRATYYASCMRVDHQLGLLIDALNAKDLFDDTAIFVFSDHGDFAGDYGLVEKVPNSFEDCLTKVPFVIKPPKNILTRPRVSDALVELVDFSATVYDLTGIEPTYDHFGQSLVPLMMEECEFREAVFCEGGRLRGETQSMELESPGAHDPNNKYWPKCSLQILDEPIYHGKASMCRTRKFKYVRRFYEKDEFYDLEADPMELKNEIDNPDYIGKIAELKELMLSWYQETCDTVPMKIDQR